MGTATPDMPVAATGVYGYRNRSYKRFAFDLQAASCLQFCMECLLPQLMFNLENIKVLLIGADKMSSIVDYTDRSTCIILEMVQVQYCLSQP
jgi:3-oxoacyl-[acyl-carrier-protein] synthase-3